MRDRDLYRELIERARIAGFDAFCLTVDCPVPGNERDYRHGLATRPRRLTPAALIQHYCQALLAFHFLKNPDLMPTQFTREGPIGQTEKHTITAMLREQINVSVSWIDCARFIAQWNGICDQGDSLFRIRRACGSDRCCSHHRLEPWRAPTRWSHPCNRCSASYFGSRRRPDGTYSRRQRPARDACREGLSDGSDRLHRQAAICLQARRRGSGRGRTGIHIAARRGRARSGACWLCIRSELELFLPAQEYQMMLLRAAPPDRGIARKFSSLQIAGSLSASVPNHGPYRPAHGTAETEFGMMRPPYAGAAFTNVC